MAKSVEKRGQDHGHSWNQGYIYIRVIPKRGPTNILLGVTNSIENKIFFSDHQLDVKVDLEILYLNKFLCGNYMYDGSLPQGSINKIFSQIN